MGKTGENHGKTTGKLVKTMGKTHGKSREKTIPPRLRLYSELFNLGSVDTFSEAITGALGKNNSWMKSWKPINMMDFSADASSNMEVS